VHNFEIIMREKAKHIGICRLCKEEKVLTFEHIPPKVAFNRNTRYYSISQKEYFKVENVLDYKPKTKVIQGGMGEYCLCRGCNSFLGREYVRAYQDWARFGGIAAVSLSSDYIALEMENLNPLRILKQIVSMFICRNNPDFTALHPQLLNFVLNPKCNELPEEVHLYAYLNIEGQPRNIPIAFTNLWGQISEMSFRPFGYILSVNNETLKGNITEITPFRFYSDNFAHCFSINLFKLPTYLPYPLDYKSKEEIECLNNNERE